MYTQVQTSPRRKFFSFSFIPGGKIPQSGSHVEESKKPEYMAYGYLKGISRENDEDILMIELFGRILSPENREFIKIQKDNYKICEVKFINGDIATIKVSKKANTIRERIFNKVRCSKAGLNEEKTFNITRKIFEFLERKEYEEMADRILEIAQQKIQLEQEQSKEVVQKPEIKEPIQILSPRKVSTKNINKPTSYIYYPTLEQRKKEKGDIIIYGKLERPRHFALYYSFFKELKGKGELYVKTLYIENLLFKLRITKYKGVKVIKVPQGYKELMDILQVSRVIFQQDDIKKEYPLSKVKVKILKEDGVLLIYESLLEEANK